MNNHNEAVQTPAEKIATFIKANTKKIIIGSIGVVLILVLIAIFDVFSAGKEEKALLQAEKIEETYSKWVNTAEADKTAVSEELEQEIAIGLRDFKGTYAEIRAYFTNGLYLAEMEKWEDSMNAFLYVSENFSDTYLAPVALFNAASIAEQSGDSAKALELYGQLIELFDTVSPDVPETLFNIGRLNEELGNAENAIAAYQRIVDDYSSSNWTNIAKSRIISINTNS